MAKSLPELICDFGLAKEHLGWLERHAEDLGGEGDHPAEQAALKDVAKQKTKTDAIRLKISKILGV